MEKHTPHCKLIKVKALVAAGQIRTTFTALSSAVRMGFEDIEAMSAVILDLTGKDFHKSMTTHADHRVWQDVYRPVARGLRIYLKLTVIDDVLIVSFKDVE